jgi:TctA family transporter
MKIHLDIFKLIIFTIIYIVVLLTISPFIDHIFTSLKEDEDEKESNIQILLEIIAHSILIVLLWYLSGKYFRELLENILNINMKGMTETAMEVLSGVIVVGLQRNLIQKLEYITYEHPFRFVDLYS